MVKLKRCLDGMLATLPPQRYAHVRRALLRAHLAGTSIPVGWLLRTAPSENFFSQLCCAGLCRRAVWLVLAHALAYGFWIVAWWLIGAAALEGRYDAGGWLAWVLLLVSLVGLQTLSGRWQTQFLTGAAALLKRRLLHGALRLDQDQARREGAGQLLGRVLEAEAIESLALNGGMSAALALIEIAVSLVLLTYGAGGGLHAVLLLLWLSLAAVLTWRYVWQRRVWTRSRLDLTHHLTEQMLGHRTRLVQQPVAQWHDGEDAALSHYAVASKNMDRWAITLTTLVPRGWLIVSLIALAPALFAGASTQALSIGVGACLLAYAALQKSTRGLMQLAAAVIAWDQAAPVFRAGTKKSRPALKAPAAARGGTVFSAQDVVFRYRSQGEAILRGIDLQVQHGERILLEGASGGGKSTLANIITGLRRPESGLLLLNGLDHQTLGDTWRQHAVNVPQFHENHVLSESLAFNLLLGRDWPPSPADLEEAEALCRTLGLGELLERMPNGLWQMIGENGWRLSHGERSRVYLARALLQPASLMVFDESFAALDPENLARAIDCVIERAPSLIVIAHP
ncbi:MAG: ATP-binding cassette domain-containing protein [Gammaproteobacteria bacterium]|nr:ATP-binding cassette domain-containing protein [Gammaproteobacteria bacterium]